MMPWLMHEHALLCALSTARCSASAPGVAIVPVLEGRCSQCEDVSCAGACVSMREGRLRAAVRAPCPGGRPGRGLDEQGRGPACAAAARGANRSTALRTQATGSFDRHKLMYRLARTSMHIYPNTIDLIMQSLIEAMSVCRR